jgi:CRP-like cAMP-binding protein
MADLRKIKDKAAEATAKGKLEKAASLYREALEGDPKDVATRQKLAEVLRRAGRIPEAIETYRDVADRFGRDGLLIKAIAISKTILELDPDHVETQSALAELYARRAAAEGSRPPVRGTLMMAAVRAPPTDAGSAARGVVVPPSPGGAPPAADQDAVVAIPLKPAAPPSPAAVPPPLPIQGYSDPFASSDPFAPSDPFGAPLDDIAVTVDATGVASDAQAVAAGEEGVRLDAAVGERASATPARPTSRPQGVPATALEEIVSAAGAALDAGVEEQIVFEPDSIDVSGSDELLDPYVPPDASSPAPPEARRGVSAALPSGAPPAAPEPPRRPAAVSAAPPGQPAAAELPRVPIFSDLSRDAFLALTRGMVLHRLSTGEAVIQEGDTGTSFYVVATGRLAVTRRDEHGDEVVLGRLGEGDFFGEMALLSGAPRSATVAAEDACEVLELRADVLADIARRHPHLAESLRRFYRQRLLANAMTVSPIFRPFGRGDRKLIMARFRAREVRAGDVVVREGEPSDGLYVVLEGEIDVVKRTAGGKATVGRLREGDVFGEMSCLRKAPASASVVVARGGTLLRLPRGDFDWLVVTYPQVLERVSELSEERSENLDAILSGRAQWTEDGLVLV